MRKEEKENYKISFFILKYRSSNDEMVSRFLSQRSLRLCLSEIGWQQETSCQTSMSFPRQTARKSIAVLMSIFRRSNSLANGVETSFSNWDASSFNVVSYSGICSISSSSERNDRSSLPVDATVTKSADWKCRKYHPAASVRSRATMARTNAGLITDLLALAGDDCRWCIADMIFSCSNGGTNDSDALTSRTSCPAIAALVSWNSRQD